MVFKHSRTCEATLLCRISETAVFPIRTLINRDMLSVFDVYTSQLRVENRFLVVITAESLCFELNLSSCVHWWTNSFIDVVFIQIGAGRLP